MAHTSSPFVTRHSGNHAAIRRVSLRLIPLRLIPLRLILAGTVLLACLLVAGDAFGCPNCKDAVNTSDPEGLNVARGYFYSILIMLAMPFTLISSFGIYVWREMQRQKRAGLSPADLSVVSSQGRLSSEPSSPPLV